LTLFFILVGSVFSFQRCAKSFTSYEQGTGIKGKEMALVRLEKASRTALQTSTVN